MNRSRIKKEKSFTLSEKATHIVMPTIMHRRSCIDVIRAKIGSIMPAPAEEGFTLAEVLITLGIIGVVAAITIPGLITNIQDYHLKKKWKKVFADVANAYRLGMDDEELYIPKIEGEAYNSVDELYYRIFSNLSPLSMCVNHITNPSGKMIGGNCYNYGLGKLYNKGFNAIICTSLNGDAKSCAYNNMNGNALLKNGAILFAHGQLSIDVIGDSGGNSGSGGVSGGSTNIFGGVRGNASSGGKSVDSTYTKRNQKDNWIQSIPLDPSKFRFDLEVYVPNPDDVVIAPERVWRDDIFTYIDLGKKALNMIQRPVVSMIVERGEVPVGFRTKGPNNRLIIVEGVGDMVLRNGKRLVCVKLRRSDASGLEYAINADDDMVPQWDVPAPLPERNNGNSNVTPMPYPGGQSYNSGNGAPAGSTQWQPQGMPAQYDIQAGSSEIIVPQYGSSGGPNVGVSYSGPVVQGNVGNTSFDYSKMQRISNSGNSGSNPYLQQYGYGSGFNDANTNISIELGTDGEVGNLESLWDNISGKYAQDLKKYEPFFSVDAPADGQGKELFHLRVGPVNSLEEGDRVCSKLGRDGIFCSVVRTQ